MGFFEHAVAELNQIETMPQLQSYLVQLTTLPHMQWCCLIVQNCNLAYIGEVPEEIKQTLTLPNLKRIYAQCYKPVWAGSDALLSSLSMPQNSMLVPIAALRPDYACLTLGFTNPVFQRSMVEKLGWCWQIIATHVYDTYRRVTVNKSAPEIQLTPREIECTHWAAQGKTSWEISRILGITERTVNFHFTNSMQKTGSVNRQQLIRNCLNLI